MPYCPSCNENGVDLPGELYAPCERFGKRVIVFAVAAFFTLALVAIVLTRNQQ